MNDWYIIYTCTLDGETDVEVMTVSREFAATEKDARREAEYSLSALTGNLDGIKIVRITDDPTQVPDDLDTLSLDDAEAVLRDPDAIHIPEKSRRH